MNSAVPGALAPPTALAPQVSSGRKRMIPVWIAGFVLSLVFTLVVAGPALAPQNPDRQHLHQTLEKPSSTNLLGTDELGRDVLSRTIVGTRAAVVGPLAVAVVCALVGGFLGLLAGFSGGVVDTFISRMVDIIYALPALLIAIVLVGIVGGGYWLTALVLVLLSFPYQARLCRSATLGQSRLTYVDAARTLGVSRRRILVRHLLPNILPTLLTAFLLDFVFAMISYAALAYLGIGVSPSSTAWGAMIAQGQPYIATNPWLTLGPAALLVATAASATLLGDWAYDRYAEAER